MTLSSLNDVTPKRASKTSFSRVFGGSSPVPSESNGISFSFKEKPAAQALSKIKPMVLPVTRPSQFLPSFSSKSSSSGPVIVTRKPKSQQKKPLRSPNMSVSSEEDEAERANSRFYPYAESTTDNDKKGQQLQDNHLPNSNKTEVNVPFYHERHIPEQSSFFKDQGEDLVAHPFSQEILFLPVSDETAKSQKSTTFKVRLENTTGESLDVTTKQLPSVVAHNTAKTTTPIVAPCPTLTIHPASPRSLLRTASCSSTTSSNASISSRSFVSSPFEVVKTGQGSSPGAFSFREINERIKSPSFNAAVAAVALASEISRNPYTSCRIPPRSTTTTTTASSSSSRSRSRKATSNNTSSNPTGGGGGKRSASSNKATKTSGNKTKRPTFSAEKPHQLPLLVTESNLPSKFVLPSPLEIEPNPNNYDLLECATTTASSTFDDEDDGHSLEELDALFEDVDPDGEGCLSDSALEALMEAFSGETTILDDVFFAEGESTIGSTTG